MTCYNKKIKIKYTRILLFSLFLSFIQVAFGQIETQSSQYMLNMGTFNPASIGENSMVDVTVQQRWQWVGIPGAPQTTYFTINAPFKLNNGANQAVGVNFLLDQAGAFKNQSASLQYAFKKKIGRGIFSLGANVGFMSIGFMADSAKQTISSEYHEGLSDSKVPATDETGIGLDLGIGAFFSTPKYYGGISYVHLNSPSFHLGDSAIFHTGGIGYLTGGYNLAFDDPKFILKSSTLIKSDFRIWQVDLSSRIEYDEKFWGGLSYRFQDAVIVFAGINAFNGFSIGYSYDISTSALSTVSSGSHEIYVSYSFALDNNKNKKKYKSIRIL